MAYNRIKSERYLGGNKIGKSLARILKKKTALNYIEKIQSSIGTTVYNTSNIARTFQECYTKLYAINQNESTEQIRERKVKTREFLNEIGLNKIMEDKSSALEDPITEEEVIKILNETPTGKSPGPDGLTILYY